MPTRRLSVLWLSPFLPSPPEHGGAVRIYNLLRRLAAWCDIDLVALADDRPAPAAVEALQCSCRSVYVALRPAGQRMLPTRLAPPAVYLDDAPEMHACITRCLAAHSYDILQVEYPSLSQYLRYRRDSATFLTEHDVTYLTLYRRARLERSLPLKLRRLLAAGVFLYYERRHLPRFDTVITVSEHDRRALLRQMPALRTAVIPNGVDCDYFRPLPASQPGQNVVFVGNFQHPPNVDAVLFFARQAWPLVRARYPEARFVVLGANPPAELRALAGAGIEVAGRVPDLRGSYASASVAVVPLRFGSGTRLKILEAFAAGVPVLSTALGAEGLDIEPERHYLEAATPRSLAGQACRLLADAGLRERLAQEGRRLVERAYDWPILAGRQMELYEQHAHAR